MHAPIVPRPHNPWHWRLPALAAVVLVAGVIAFVVYVLQQDRAERRTSMISDVLWLEQNLRFHFERNEELLARLGADLLDAQPDGVALARARQALAPETGLSEIAWLDAAERELGSIPPHEIMRGPALQASMQQALRRARALGKPNYCELAEDLSGPTLCVAVPVFQGLELRGFAVGFYGLQRLLGTQVAWWFSERYRLTVQDQQGREIASKSRVAVLNPELSYEMPFQPPGNGLNLRVEAYRSRAPETPVLFGAAVVICALALFASLWMLVRHIRRRHEVEAALVREYSFRRAMEESVHTGLRARDLEGRTTYVNRAFCEIVGWPADALLGKSSPMPYWLPEDYETNSATHRRVLAGEASHQSIELRFQRQNGEVFDALIFEAPLIDADGKHFGWMASLLDITDRKRAEELARTQQERLQATARLVTTGELASTLAHELNQPLAAIATYVSGCQTGLANGVPHAQLAEVMQKIAHQTQRAGNIIHRIQNFVRRSEPRLDPVDLARVVREAAALLESSAHKRQVRISLAFPHEMPPVEGDATLLEQVLVNLMRNGMDAMADTPEPLRVLRVAVVLAEGSVSLRVADHGTGIRPEVAERLFSPFFTTKAEGMGMGLSICRSIIEWHRGRLHHEANPEGGTVFCVTLPRAGSRTPASHRLENVTS